MTTSKADDSLKIQELFQTVALLPSFSSATIFPSSDADSARVAITASVRDLARNTRTKISTDLTVSGAGKHVIEGFTNEVAEGVNLVATIGDGKRWVVLKSSDDKEKGGKKRFVQVWQAGRILKNIEVTEAHGDFFADDTFGSISVSGDEKTVVYIAEKKTPEDKGPAKFTFKPDWGEKLVKKGPSVIALCNLETEKVSVVKDQKDLVPGQVAFGPNDKSLIFWGVKTHPRQYGILFCPNRVSGIYQTDLEGNDLKLLSEGGEAARSPRLDSKREKVFYLSNAIGGPHFTCAKLRSYTFSDQKLATIVDQVAKANQEEFPGLFTDRLPNDSVIGEGKEQWIITPTAWRSRRTVIAIHATSGKVIDLAAPSGPGSWSVLGVKGKWLVAVRSEPHVPHEVYVGSLKLTADNATVTLHLAHKPSGDLPKVQWKVNVHTARSDILESVVLSPPSDGQASSLLQGQKPPLLVYPHGGPHANFTTEWSAYNYFLVRLGAVLAMVNYRGSTGYGKDGIDSLIGNIGDLDVEDTHFVAEELRTSGEVDPTRVAVWGGSHGGFVSAFLVGRYPTYYKACVLRNPVIDVGSNLAQSDIPDWSLAEAGVPYDLNQPPLITPDIYAKLWAMSPMSLAHAVKTPSLVMLGENDRRVPSYQGTNWFYYLKGRGGVDVRAMMFPENGHALDGVEAEKAGMQALAEFLIEFLSLKPHDGN
ncbi:Alpha/Beta hydrolase protein [Phlyctochytrium arcticum]|nr:Alpha/Beta hydrolase protein [Phlyctochytrium arcticum]